VTPGATGRPPPTAPGGDGRGPRLPAAPASDRPDPAHDTPATSDRTCRARTGAACHLAARPVGWLARGRGALAPLDPAVGWRPPQSTCTETAPPLRRLRWVDQRPCAPPEVARWGVALQLPPD